MCLQSIAVCRRPTNRMTDIFPPFSRHFRAGHAIHDHPFTPRLTAGPARPHLQLKTRAADLANTVNTCFMAVEAGTPLRVELEALSQSLAAAQTMDEETAEAFVAAEPNLRLLAGAVDDLHAAMLTEVCCCLLLLLLLFVVVGVGVGGGGGGGGGGDGDVAAAAAAAVAAAAGCRRCVAATLTLPFLSRI